MRIRSLLVAAIAAGAFVLAGGTAHAEGSPAYGTGATVELGAETFRLSYMGAYPSLEECEAAGQRFLGVDYFCFEGNNDGRPVWELWVESNEP